MKAYSKSYLSPELIAEKINELIKIKMQSYLSTTSAALFTGLAMSAHLKEMPADNFSMYLSQTTLETGVSTTTSAQYSDFVQGNWSAVAVNTTTNDQNVAEHNRVRALH